MPHARRPHDPGSLNQSRPADGSTPPRLGAPAGRNHGALSQVARIDRSVVANRRRTVLIAVLAVVAALLIPAVFAASKAHADTHDPIGSLDSVTVSPAGLARISGWAADSDAPTTPIAVTFSDNGTSVVSWLASQSRPDVGGAYPGYGNNHGFQYDLSLADGAHTICVNAHNLGAGANDQLGCASVTIRNNPSGTQSPASVTGNTATITGTATDPNTTGGVLVRVYRDGSYVAGATTDPTSHAYSLSVPVAEGPHSLCVYLINSGAGTNVGLTCQSVTVRNNPFGAVESVGQTPAGVQVVGWAIDLNTKNPIVVRAYVDNNHVADGTASIPRSDIGAKYPSVGANHGYTFTLNVAQGTHSICVRASNVSYGVSTTLGCQTITVLNNPVGALETAVQAPGTIKIAGYAFDLNTTQSISVQVAVDGKPTTTVVASGSRPDLSSRYPTAGTAHGYAITLPYATGSHVICVTALNVGAGTNVQFPCRRVTMQNSPAAKLDWAIQYPGGVQIRGWALDPDTTGSIAVHAYIDGKFATMTTANLSRPGVVTLYPYNGTLHGFQVNVPMTPGPHQLCVYALNVHAGANNQFFCGAVTRLINPTGVNTTIARSGTSNTLMVSGWAIDPDTTGSVAVHVTIDGQDKGTITANAASAASTAAFPLYGGNHGYSGSITIDPGEHIACVVLHNVGAGADLRQHCVRINTSGMGAPAVATNLQAWAGSKQVTLSWTAPLSANAPITGYLLTIDGHTVPVSGAVTSVVAYSLTNGHGYTFNIRAINKLGTGSPATTYATPTNIPPQTTPAPVSTSHYVRNLSGNLTSDAALMRSMGAADAARNPSGHNYLILLQIGGQDEADGGALLSATARFVTYSAVVSAMKAYLDGYATQQRPYAPLTLAIGTNNDVDVSRSAGISWAQNVVNPVQAYAAAKHPGTIIAGANDMEPGFSGSVSATRAWLSGYLSASSARFVFNGSADGCSTGVAGSGCNNGWRMSDLQWLSGGAAPTRTISLPQIYNYAMPLQWKYISLTGTNSGLARINFGGPLTEYTACVQAGSCGSISNTVAWSQLWSAIQSTAATRQSQLPNGTDLRIN